MNKSNVWIIVGAIGLVFATGFIAARISTKPEMPAVQSQDSEAARLEAEAELAEEIAKRSAEEASTAQYVSRKMHSGFDRLAELNARPHLYDSEKDESRKIFQRLLAYYGKLEISYDESTGKVSGIAAVYDKAWNTDRQRIVKLQQKAVDDARIAAEKRLECLKYAASKR